MTKKKKKTYDVYCPYCNQRAEFTDSKEVYGKSYGMIYLCKCVPSWAYVGCHKGSNKPLGRLADKRLREYKKKVHAAFDPLWESDKMKRAEAYEWLAKEMNIDKKECHVGMFDIERCQVALLTIMGLKQQEKQAKENKEEEKQIQQQRSRKC